MEFSRKNSAAPVGNSHYSDGLVGKLSVPLGADTPFRRFRPDDRLLAFLESL